MDHGARLARFEEELAPLADLAFLPISADLQYVSGVPRDIPTFGWTMHPGAWLEGLWLRPGRPAVLALPRMTAEFGGLGSQQGVNIRVLGDHDDPAVMVADILDGLEVGSQPRIATGDRAHAETLVGLQTLRPGAHFLSATEVLRRQRVIKSEEEIEVMRHAGAMTEAAFRDAIPTFRPGMTELEVLNEVNFQMRRRGSLGESFTSALYTSGPNHPLIMADRLQRMTRRLDPPIAVQFDFGGILDGYCYDYGRTISFGQPDDEMVRVHELVMASQAAGIEALQAGVHTTAQADAIARKVIEDGGYGEEFRHRLGHAIGLDVHEPPFLTASDRTMLREGMLFTIEPSIMQMNGFSARVEDVVVARPGGGEKLTDGYQDLIVID